MNTCYFKPTFSQITDYCPIISFGSAIRHFVLLKEEQNQEVKDSKGWGHCERGFLALIPIIGNLILLVHDLHHHKKEAKKIQKQRVTHIKNEDIQKFEDERKPECKARSTEQKSFEISESKNEETITNAIELDLYKQAGIQNPREEEYENPVVTRQIEEMMERFERNQKKQQEDVKEEKDTLAVQDQKETDIEGQEWEKEYDPLKAQVAEVLKESQNKIDDAHRELNNAAQKIEHEIRKVEGFQKQRHEDIIKINKELQHQQEEVKKINALISEENKDKEKVQGPLARQNVKKDEKIEVNEEELINQQEAILAEIERNRKVLPKAQIIKDEAQVQEPEKPQKEELQPPPLDVKTKDAHVRSKHLMATVSLCKECGVGILSTVDQPLTSDNDNNEYIRVHYNEKKYEVAQPGEYNVYKNEANNLEIERISDHKHVSPEQLLKNIFGQLSKKENEIPKVKEPVLQEKKKLNIVQKSQKVASYAKAKNLMATITKCSKCNVYDVENYEESLSYSLDGIVFSVEYEEKKYSLDKQGEYNIYKTDDNKLYLDRFSKHAHKKEKEVKDLNISIINSNVSKELKDLAKSIPDIFGRKKH